MKASYTKSLVIVIALAAVLISCSKPSQESSEKSVADSTESTTDSNNSYSNPNPVVAQPEPAREPFPLTGDDLEKFKIKLFLELRKHEILPGQQLIAYENFQFKADASVQYDVVVYNRVYSRYDEKGERILDGGESREVYWSPDKTITVPIDEPVNRADTIYYEISEIVISDISAPEDSVKKFKCAFGGKRVWTNHYGMTTYGQNYFAPIEDPIPSIVIELGDSLFTSDEKYLKAKVMALTDDDLAGLSKDQLGYLRNEIFARHGHTFKTPKMRDYFIGKDWYFETVRDASTYLNEFEKKNIDFIKKREG